MREIKIRIKTPKGYANKMGHRLRPWILGLTKENAIVINKDDTQFTWIVTADERRLARITRNVARFDVIMRNVLKSRPVKKLIDKHLSPQGHDELDSMLRNHTSVEIVKDLTP